MNTCRGLIALAALALAAPLAAQSVRVARFPIASQPLALEGDARPHQYLGVLGRRAAWLGVETGPAELWVHPFKLATDFTLDFRIPDYVSPVRGEDVARTVIVRPEMTTIVYTHATFTVRQHIIAPLDEPGLLVLLDVDTFRPLEIVGSFRADFQYAWPGAMGGVYAFWNEAETAYVLSESQQRRNAVIGSPWIARASDHPAHAVPNAPSTFVIPVDTARARREFIPIAMAAGTAPRDSILTIYRGLLARAPALYRERVDHARSLIASSTRLDTPDDELDRAFAWSIINLDEQLTCNPDLGCGLVAGWGPAGRGTRPGFGWFFGGDAAINSLAMDAVGLWPQVAEGLRFLARYQNREPGQRFGKIPHEISQAAARIPWFTDFPYAYYHADTTPYWVVALWQYWRASGDRALVRELWPAALDAYRWGLTRDSDGDGIIENGPGNLGAIEVGQLGVGIHQDIYLAAVWTMSLEAMSDLAGVAGDDAVAGDAAARAARARRRLNDAYWRGDEGYHAFGIMQDGTTNDNLTVWPATAAAFGLLDPARAGRTLTRLAGNTVTTPWGARILSTESEFYDPMHYNNGAVWPFVTGFVSWAQYNYSRPWAGYPLVHGLGRMTFDWARGRHPELLSGRYYRPLDTAVPQQFFATSMLVTPVVRGLLGWTPDAGARTASLRPQLPPDWDRVRVEGLRVGGATVSAGFQQRPGEFAATLTVEGSLAGLELVLPLPPGSRFLDVLEDHPTPDAVRVTEHEGEISLFVPEPPPTMAITIRWEGGLALVPMRPALEPGRDAEGIRIIDFTYANNEWTLTVEPGSESPETVVLIGEPVVVDGAPEPGQATENMTVISIPPAAGPGDVVRHLKLRRKGPSPGL